MSTNDTQEQLSDFTYNLKVGRKRPVRVERILRKNSLNFYAYNSCNKGKGLGLRTGFNHVQIDLVLRKPYGSKPGEAYYVMEYSKNIPEKAGSRPSTLKDTPTAIQLPLETFNPPQFENNKLKVTYTDKNGKLCNVTLGPCNTPEKETEYECPVRGIDFNDDIDWENIVNLWFQKKYDLAKKNALLSGEWQGKQQSMDPETVRKHALERAEDQLQSITEKTDLQTSQSTLQAEEHLDEAQRKLDEHHVLMKEQDKIIDKTLVKIPENETTTGGKKSRKKKRTKRKTKKRKSIRRKKAKKTKKY